MEQIVGKKHITQAEVLGNSDLCCQSFYSDRNKGH